MAFTTVLATGALAQTNSGSECRAGESCMSAPGGSGGGKAVAMATAPRSAPDMRLWSFGECGNRFPYLDSVEHKECVRVVGSEEARDARAFHVCATSHSGDPAEVARCKSAYQENREKAAQHGYVPNAPAQPQAPPSAEDMNRVRAIASAAVGRDLATAPAAFIPAGPEESASASAEESGSSMILVIALSSAVLLLGVAANFSRRKQARVLSSR